jgi:hypothetical protein
MMRYFKRGTPIPEEGAQSSSEPHQDYPSPYTAAPHNPTCLYSSRPRQSGLKGRAAMIVSHIASLAELEGSF